MLGVRRREGEENVEDVEECGCTENTVQAVTTSPPLTRCLGRQDLVASKHESVKVRVSGRDR
jgi:hypothetical protein